MTNLIIYAIGTAMMFTYMHILPENSYWFLLNLSTKGANN